MLAEMVEPVMQVQRVLRRRNGRRFRLRPAQWVDASRLRLLAGAYGISPAMWEQWTGFVAGAWCRANPTWTEEQLCELIEENLADIVAGR